MRFYDKILKYSKAVSKSWFHIITLYMRSPYFTVRILLHQFFDCIIITITIIIV